VNAGDGFILDSTEKLIGARASHYFSNRVALSETDIAAINATACLVVAGANSLRDDFTLTHPYPRLYISAYDVRLCCHTLLV
jgi:hypothetical protein